MSKKAITNIAVSICSDDEVALHQQGFKKVDTNLCPGAAVYLWYKQEDDKAITRLQLSYDTKMSDSLIDSEFLKIDKNLNQMSRKGTAGIYLWYSKQESEYDVPIVALSVTTAIEQEGEKFKFGWERMSYATNPAPGGNRIHIWYQRKEKTYICDLHSTRGFSTDADLFKKGYIRVDQNTSLGNASDQEWVFLWYRQSIHKDNAITTIEVSTSNQEYQMYSKTGYSALVFNLNEGTSGAKVYAWFKKEQTSPIQGFTVVSDPGAMKAYEKSGLYFINKNLKKETSYTPLYIVYSKYTEDE